jgi:hypothetical protein
MVRISRLRLGRHGSGVLLDSVRSRIARSQWGEVHCLPISNQYKKPRLTAGLHGMRFKRSDNRSCLFRLAFPPSALPCVWQVPCRPRQDPFLRIELREKLLFLFLDVVLHRGFCCPRLPGRVGCEADAIRTPAAVFLTYRESRHGGRVPNLQRSNQ